MSEKTITAGKIISEQTHAGGWSAYRPLTPEDQKVFDGAVGRNVGVKHTPQVVSTQVVSGMNYRFRCKAEVTSNAQVSYEAILQVYASPENKPYITHIYAI